MLAATQCCASTHSPRQCYVRDRRHESQMRYEAAPRAPARLPAILECLRGAFSPKQWLLHRVRRVFEPTKLHHMCRAPRPHSAFPSRVRAVPALIRVEPRGADAPIRPASQQRLLALRRACDRVAPRARVPLHAASLLQLQLAHQPRVTTQPAADATPRCQAARSVCRVPHLGSPNSERRFHSRSRAPGRYSPPRTKRLLACSRAL